MKLPLGLCLCAIACFVSLCFAWEKEDHDIFRLRDEVIQHEGKGVTFYDFLGVSPSASQEEIVKAGRRQAKRLHPDKAIPSLIAQREAAKRAASKPTSKSGDKKKKPGVQVTKGLSQKEKAQISREATERHARLNVISGILKDSQRERYDYFLNNGFPKWRGTGYYYARFRPGLGSVMVGLLIVFGGAAHYGAMYISWKRQRDFVQRYISHARRMAWGNDAGIPGIPGLENISNTSAPLPPQQEDDQAAPLNRRQKRMQEKENKKKDSKAAAKAAKANGISKPVDAQNVAGPTGSKKKVIAENGKVLIVDSVGNVFLEEETEEGVTHEFLLDPNEIPKPTILQTALFRLPVWVYAQTLGRAVDKVRGTSTANEPFLDKDGSDLTMQMNPENDEDGVFETATSVNANSEVKKRKARARKS